MINPLGAISNTHTLLIFRIFVGIKPEETKAIGTVIDINTSIDERYISILTLFIEPIGVENMRFTVFIGLKKCIISRGYIGIFYLCLRFWFNINLYGRS